MDPAATELDQQLRRHNGSLAAAGIRLRLERRGMTLGLRGPLPCSDGDPQRSVQRLSLGLPANQEGLDRARMTLERVQRDLEQGHFRWSDWRQRSPSVGMEGTQGSRPRPSPLETVAPAGSPPAGGPAGRLSDERTLASAAADQQPPPPSGSSSLATGLEAFKVAFFADPRRRRNPSGSRSTWVAAYRPYLRRLESLAAGGSLSRELLEQALESYGLATRSRQQCGLALAALARHQGLVLPDDWSERSGGYGLHRARFRQLPSDGQILGLVTDIPNPAWRLVYGVMATYGLRNHEVFFCDFSGLAAGGDRVLRVLPTSKTGEHQVWPFHPEWVEHFGLARLGQDPRALPSVRTDLRRTTLQQVGQRVAEQFHRYELPFTPYDLRHAWAVRTIHIGLPDTVAARMMGHSVAIHTRTYHHWITRRDQQQAVDAALARLVPQRVA